MNEQSPPKVAVITIPGEAAAVMDVQTFTKMLLHQLLEFAASPYFHDADGITVKVDSKIFMSIGAPPPPDSGIIMPDNKIIMPN